MGQRYEFSEASIYVRLYLESGVVQSFDLSESIYAHLEDLLADVRIQPVECSTLDLLRAGGVWRMKPEGADRGALEPATPVCRSKSRPL